MRGVPGALPCTALPVLLAAFFFGGGGGDFLRSSASSFDSSFLRQLSSTRGRIVGEEFNKRFFLVSFEPFLLLLTVSNCLNEKKMWEKRI